MMDAIGINVYGGGFTLGVQSNFKVRGQWEEVDLGYKTWELNFDRTKIDHPASINDWPIEKYVGVPFIYANPPCAPWSSANMRPGYTKDKRFADERLALTDHTMAAALQLKPMVFISESVENAYNYGFSFYRKHVDAWLAAGYAVTIFLTDAVIHGLPSIRRRFHFIAHRYALNLTKPNLEGFVPTMVKDAFAGLPVEGDVTIQHDVTRARKISEKYKQVFSLIDGGRSSLSSPRVLDLYKAGYSGPRRGFLVIKLIWNSPSNTMVGLEALLHPSEPRYTTWREGMRLLSMPDSFRTLSSIDASDNVTPLMGRYLSTLALDCIKRKRRCQPVETLVDWRPLGKPYQVAKYRKLNEEAKP